MPILAFLPSAAIFSPFPRVYAAMIYTACLMYFIAEAHYRVTINISKTNESLSYGGEVGMFVLRVIGANGKQTERLSLSEHSKYYEPGSRHTVVIAGEVVGKVEAVEISWEYQTSMFNPLTWRLLHKPKAYIDSLTIKSLEFHNE